VVLELDAGREGVALTLHQLEDLRERRVASAPRQVFGAVCGGGAIFQVDAGDATVELSQERNRALTGASHVMSEIDVRQVRLRQRERLIERGHRRLRVRVIRGVDLSLL